MKKLILIALCLALSGCINATYRQTAEVTDFRFRMWNESDIEKLDIKTPNGWEITAEKMGNKTSIDQGILAEAVIKTIKTIP